MDRFPPRPTMIVAFRGSFDKSDIFIGENRTGELPPSLISFLNEIVPHARIFAPKMNLSAYSTEDANDIADNILSQVDEEYSVTKPDEILFISFSSGALFARSVYTKAFGAQADATVDLTSAREWAPKVTRIISLSGILRGWSISTATPANIRFLAPMFQFAVRVYCWRKAPGQMPLFFQLRRGEPFVVQSRLQQLSVEQALQRSSVPRRAPLFVNVLGTLDEFVSPADCIDTTPDQQHLFVEVPGTTHLNIVNVDLKNVAKDARDTIEYRRSIFERIITESSVNLSDIAICHDDINDYFDALDRPEDEYTGAALHEIKQAIIILHGIRDEGFWTKRIAKEIKKIGRKPTLEGPIAVRAPTPTYGFFSMWNFIRPWMRRKQTCWFMEQYCEVRKFFPNAKISFIGHSNGTYLAKLAMEMCSAIHFERLIFAGSVVRTDQDWAALDNQIGNRVLNITAASDRVVALLPGAMERLRLKYLDVGGSGYFGFKGPNTSPKLHQIGPIKGNHSAAVGEDWWSRLAAFAVEGRTPEPEDALRSRALELFVWIWPAVLVLLLLLVATIIYFTVFVGYWWPWSPIVVSVLAVIVWKFVRFW